MSEILPRLLTVKTLIEDLADFDEDAEVSVAIHGIPVTIPIGGLSKANMQDEDGTPKNYVLFMVSEQNVTNVFDIVNKLNIAAKEGEVLQLN